jgi:hypothetical protein
MAELMAKPCRFMTTGMLVEAVAAGQVAKAFGGDKEPGTPNWFLTVKGDEAAFELDRRFPVPPLAEGEEEPKSWVEIEGMTPVGTSCGDPDCMNCAPKARAH